MRNMAFDNILSPVIHVGQNVFSSPLWWYQLRKWNFDFWYFAEIETIFAKYKLKFLHSGRIGFNRTLIGQESSLYRILALFCKPENIIVTLLYLIWFDLISSAESFIINNLKFILLNQQLSPLLMIVFSQPLWGEGG